MLLSFVFFYCFFLSFLILLSGKTVNLLDSGEENKFKNFGFVEIVKTSIINFIKRDNDIEKFVESKGVIRVRKSKKNRQHNDQNKKD